MKSKSIKSLLASVIAIERLVIAAWLDEQADLVNEEHGVRAHAAVTVLRNAGTLIKRGTHETLRRTLVRKVSAKLKAEAKLAAERKEKVKKRKAKMKKPRRTP